MPQTNPQRVYIVWVFCENNSNINNIMQQVKHCIYMHIYIYINLHAKTNYSSEGSMARTFCLHKHGTPMATPKPKTRKPPTPQLQETKAESRSNSLMTAFLIGLVGIRHCGTTAISILSSQMDPSVSSLRHERQ